MDGSQVDFSMISKALSFTVDALKSDNQTQEQALQDLLLAQKDLLHALSCCSR